MKNITKKYFYSITWLLLLANSYSVSLAGWLNVKSTSSATNLVNDSWSWNLVWTVEAFLWYIVWLLYLVAVVFGLYGGFQILTAGWDDGKVKAWKTTLINAALWLAAIFLASTIINWIMRLFSGTGADRVIVG